MRTMISATLPGHVGNLPYGRMITTLLTRLGVDLVDERIQEKSFSSPLDWETISKMGMRDAQVSDDERNALVHSCTRVEMIDAEAAAAAAGAGVHGGDAGDDDCLYMDVDSIPPPSPKHTTGAGPFYVAGPSHPPPDDMMGILHEIREAPSLSDLRVRELLDAQRVTDRRMTDLTASLQTTQTQIAWLTRVYAKDYDRDREAPPPPSPPAS
ncbi:hypothetical protein NE237_018563 [Protea cynaroides]|uniref:Uncharacterized protein n=1 Tax=Protea cynaroides TaxID=273540 RepID=A0A9Q0KA83_9MAGN|nr:hypothetical protein NE237_018563 [Protea cynaroides]